MEVIELNHEVCYRSLNELLEDLCPRSSMIAVSSVRLNSSNSTVNPDLAILSDQKLIIVQDIQNAIDYISAENLTIIDVDRIDHMAFYGRLIALDLRDEPDVTIAESKTESGLPLELGFDTTFATLAAAIEELVVPAESETVQQVEPKKATALIPAEVKISFDETSTKKEEFQPQRSSKWIWISLLLLLLICAGLYFIPWNGSSEQTAESIVPVESVAVVEEKVELAENTALPPEKAEADQQLEKEVSAQTPTLPARADKVVKVSSYKETIYGEVWPNIWTNSASTNKNIEVTITGKGSLYQVEYLVNGQLKQTLFVVPNTKRSQQQTKGLAVGKVNSYSNPSSEGEVHVDVINGTLDDLISDSGKSPELHISIESASYTAAFRF